MLPPSIVDSVTNVVTVSSVVSFIIDTNEPMVVLDSTAKVVSCMVDTSVLVVVPDEMS